MIPGLSSPGLAGAIRSAAKARATMDAMSRQIATGQRVVSVKDDAGAWARAAMLRSDSRGRETIAQDLRGLSSSVAAARASLEARVEMQGQLRGVALAAQDPGLPAGTRSNLQAEATGISNAMGDLPAFVAEMPVTAVDGSVWNATQASAVNRNFAFVTDLAATQRQTAFTAFAAMPQTVDVSTQAAAATLLSQATVRETNFALRAAELGAAERGLDRLSGTLDGLAAAGQQMASALTEADLGKASAVRAQAETRQQLAITTVRQAISTYAGFATGLLGNVQRTQRGVMA